MIYLASAVGIIVIIIGIVVYLSNDAARSTETFFTSIKDDQTDTAYESTSKQFKLVISKQQFQDYVALYEIKKFKSFRWSSRNTNVATVSIVTLAGTARKEDGTNVPLSIQLIKEEKEWKILSIDIKGGVTKILNIPEKNTLIKLVNDSMQSFSDSVNADDFEILYGTISKIWQNQSTPQSLSDAFKIFTEEHVNLDLRVGNPVFTQKPQVDNNNLLVVQGYYIYPNDHFLNFLAKYNLEDDVWKLISLKVTISQNNE